MKNKIIFPVSLNPKEEILFLSGKSVDVPKAIMKFDIWKGNPIKDTYGGKTVIDYDREPLFAELAVLKILQKAGWDGVWVDNYRKAFRQGLPEKMDPVELPDKYKEILDSIKVKNGTLSGCWDVFAWNGDNILFAELKRIGKDMIRDTQKKWLETSVSMGYTDRFLLVDWDIIH